MDSEPQSLLLELQTADEMALIFNPIGLGGRMEPEDAAVHQAQTIANAQLIDEVPEPLRENFERARKLHLYGVLEYEFFTAAADYALLVLEGALRLRFVSYYDHRIPIFRGSQETFLEAPDFEPVLKAKKTTLRRGETKEHLPKYLRALLKWARDERLLPGRRTRIVDQALTELRNYSAHPTGRAIGGPPDSARTLRDVAEYINCLWGFRAENGRLFGGPRRRRLRVAAVDPNSSAAAQMDLDHVAGITGDKRSWTYAVFLAVDEEELILPFRGFAYQEGFQGTMYPCEQLWIGSWEDLAAKVHAGEFLGLEDSVECFDRLFLLRMGEEEPDIARSPQDFLALTDPPDGTWLAIIADAPQEAFVHVRDHEPLNEVSCPNCFVDIQGRFDSPVDVATYAHEYVALK